MVVDANALLAPDCGSESPATPERDARVRECLLTAYDAGTTARATLVGWTTEGDPITFALQARGAGDVRVAVDTTRDRFGPGGVLRIRCAALARSTGSPDSRSPIPLTVHGCGPERSAIGIP